MTAPSTTAAAAPTKPAPALLTMLPDGSLTDTPKAELSAEDAPAPHIVFASLAECLAAYGKSTEPEPVRMRPGQTLRFPR